MKILHTVEWYYPSIGGSQEVVKQLSERLVKRGHEVTVATSKMAERKNTTINGVHIEEFDITGNAVRGITGEVERYRKFLIEGDYDIILNYSSQLWTSDLFFPLMQTVKGKKVFVPCGFSALFTPEYTTYFEAMKSWMRIYDATVFLSNDYQDINFYKQHGGKNVHIIPNGADEEEFLKTSDIDIRESLKIPTDHFLILHVGSHTGQKGHREALEIFKRAKIRHVTFLMVANPIGIGCTLKCQVKGLLFRLNPFERLRHRQIIITPLSREMTLAAYQAADLFLFPSNIECSPIVLFECMASKTPFLTTDVGNAAEIIRWSGGSGVLLPTTKDDKGFSTADIQRSVSTLEDLYADPKERGRMQEAGYQAWLQRFTWDTITDEYEKLYYSLVV
jgi:glycosyltransferase involved in cell wall biosynthesis